jgi:hypothetical protein
MISLAVEERLKDAVEAINDVTVHIDPENDERAKPCCDLPLRQEALRRLEALWPDLPEPHRITLHYLSGRIDVDVELPIAYADAQRAEALQGGLQEALRSDPIFGRVRASYGTSAQ